MEKRGCRRVIAYSAWCSFCSTEVNLTMPAKPFTISIVIEGGMRVRCGLRRRRLGGRRMRVRKSPMQYPQSTTLISSAVPTGNGVCELAHTHLSASLCYG